VILPDDLLILASASPRRRKLLAELGVRFEAHPCPLSELVCRPAGTVPAAWAEALAYFKARAVAERHAGRWVLGADTVVVCEGELLGKPRDVRDAARMLELQSGRPTAVITGMSLVCRRDEVHRIICHDTTVVWMRDAPEQRRAYLAGGEWCGKAGAYGIQDVGDKLVERVEGSFSNVVGLPLELVRRVLRVAGRLPVERAAR
jgi:septum formation protein